MAKAAAESSVEHHSLDRLEILERQNRELVSRLAEVTAAAALNDEVRRKTQEREVVLRRFYRSEKMRSTPGVGLGLNLVAAIAKLHGFRLVIHSGPGGRMEIVCPGPQPDSIATVR